MTPQQGNAQIVEEMAQLRQDFVERGAVSNAIIADVGNLKIDIENLSKRMNAYDTRAEENHGILERIEKKVDGVEKKVDGYEEVFTQIKNGLRFVGQVLIGVIATILASFIVTHFVH